MITKTTSSFAEKCLLSTLLIFLSVIAAAVVGFAFGISISRYTLPVGIAAFMAAAFFADRKLFLSGLINLSILIFFTVISRYIFDWSYDGMYYHKQAVITLKEGWNPLYQTAAECDIFATYPDMSLWLENYPKGLWIFSAAIYAVTNLLECAKAVNILFILAVFYAACDTMRTVFGASRKKSIFFGILFAVNPVFISQLFTFYNDLTVGSLTVIALLLCLKLYNNCANSYTYAALFLTTVISPLIKFTSPGLLAIVYIAFGAVCAYKHHSDMKWMIRPIAVITSGFLISLCLLGFDPYMEHIIKGQHIIHPVMGDEKYDIMNTNPPKGFDEKNPLECLFISVFSKSSNDISSEPQLKIPLTVSDTELEPISNADTRIGGFGVFFSGILILSVISALAAALSKHRMRSGLQIAIPFLFLLTLFFPESWWARYASFIYYLPVFMLIYSSGSKKASPIALVCSLLILANTAVTLFSVVTTGIDTTASLNEKLGEIKAENRKIILRVNDFPTHVKLFSEYGIDFEVSHQPIGPDEIIFYRNTKYKFAAKEYEYENTDN